MEEKKKAAIFFISKAQLLQNNRETVHEGFDRVSLEVLTVCLVPKRKHSSQHLRL